MPTLVVPASVQLCQVDDFPEQVRVKKEGDEKEGDEKEGDETAELRKCERSVRGKRKVEGGALYIRPASSVTVTDDELKHLEEHHAELLARLIVHDPGRSLADIPGFKETGKKRTEEEAAPPPPPPPPPPTPPALRSGRGRRRLVAADDKTSDEETPSDE